MYLTGKDPDAPVRLAMEGGVRWAAHSSLRSDPYWSRVTLAELELLSGTVESARTSYREAMAYSENDWFGLDSSRQQLSILLQLGFRFDSVKEAVEIVDNALRRVGPPYRPKRVVLFSGHMIDGSDRDPSRIRFPEAVVPTVEGAIGAELDSLAVEKDDLGICGGACGGDLLFAKLCLDRGLKVRLMLPSAEPEFLRSSVLPAGMGWVQAYQEAKRRGALVRVMPDELGQMPSSVNAYERCNLWQFYAAAAFRPHGASMTVVCLWDGKPGDGPGGPAHMYHLALDRDGPPHRIPVPPLTP
jgi:hypothetical protein